VAIHGKQKNYSHGSVAKDIATSAHSKQSKDYHNGVEHFFPCPYCGEEISMVLDTSVARQAYIEDCEVCCRPIEVRYTVEDEALVDFAARRIT